MFIALIVMFLLMHAIPDSPWIDYSKMDETTQATLNKRFGYNNPLAKQFLNYVIGVKGQNGSFFCGLICGNMGQSYRQQGSVQAIIFNSGTNRPFIVSKFGYSMRLGFFAFIFAFGVGLPAGIVTALKQNTFIDYLIKFITSLALAIPSFVVGLVLIIVLAGELHLIVILPTSWSTASPDKWIIPVFVLGLNTSASITRLTRSSMLEVMSQDYIRTARAKGLRERSVIYVHMLRNALIPLVTFAGPALVELMTGAFIIETMFGFPGMGRDYINSVINKDYSVILGLTVVYGLLMTIVTIIVDSSYIILDPRIRIDNA